jgi:hypothetical protein
MSSVASHDMSIAAKPAITSTQERPSTHLLCLLYVLDIMAMTTITTQTNTKMDEVARETFLDRIFK